MTQQQLINMTPHAINIIHIDGNKDRFETNHIPASGNIIRLKAKTVSTGNAINGINITETQYGEPEGLPEFEDGVFYIVSGLVKSALPHRADLLVPSELVRNEDNSIVGCQSLGV